MTAAFSNRSAKPSVPTRFVGRVFAISAVVAVTMLGNMRLQASEVHRTPSSQALPPVVAQASPSTHVVRVRETEESGDAPDELQLVPAIYAWDPAVRYVYFRHVSKWM